MEQQDQLFQLAPVALAQVDSDGVVVRANDVFARMVGLSADDLPGQPFAAFAGTATPAESPRQGAVPESVSGVWSGRHTIFPSQGDALSVRMVSSVLPGSNGETPGALIAITRLDGHLADGNDIEVERFYRQSFKDSAAVQLLIDPSSGRIADANPAAERFYGYSLDDLRSMSIQCINTLSDEEVRVEMERAAREERRHFRFCHRLADGDVRDVDVYTGPVELHGVRYLQSIIHDVTETLDHLRELSHHKNLLDAAPEYIAMLDGEGRPLYLNPALRRLCGEEDSPGGGLIEERFADWAAEQLRNEALPAAMRDGLWQGEAALIDSAGRSVPVAQTLVAHTTEGGTVERYSTVMRDLTAIREAEAFRQQLLESLAEGVVGMDRDGRATFLNPAAVRLLGLSGENEALGSDFHRLAHHSYPDGRAFPHHACSIRRVRETGRPLEAWEDVFWRRDGVPFPVVVYAAPLGKGDAAPEGVVVSFQDVSDRKAAEERLRDREARLRQAAERLRLAAEAAALDIWDLRLSDRRVQFDQGMARVYGWLGMEDGLSLDDWLAAVLPEDREGAEWAINAGIEGGQTFRSEFRIRRSDGAVRHVRATAQPILDDHGRPNRVVGIDEDITERRQAETALRSSERRYRLAQEAAHFGIWDWDLVNDRLALDEACWAMLGYGSGEARDLTYADWLELVHPDDVQDLNQLVVEPLRRGERVTASLRYRSAGGDWFWIQVSGQVLDWTTGGSPARMMGVQVDINQLKTTEAALRKRERDLHEAQRIAELGDWSYDLCSGAVHWSAEVCRILGVDPQQDTPTYARFMDAVHPEDRDRVQAMVDASTQGQPYNIVHRIVRPDGSVRKVRGRGYTRFDDSGKARRIVGTLQDITRHRILEDNLLRLVAILDSTPDLVAMHGPDGTMNYLNAAGRKYLGIAPPGEHTHWHSDVGWNRESLPETTRTIEGTHQAVHPAWALEIVRDRGFPAALAKGVWQGESAILDPQGNEIPVSQVILVHRDEAGAVTQVSTIMRDISEQKRLEAELQQQATTDRLTGVCNRQRFDVELERALAHHRRYGGCGSLIMFDIDHFKVVNDAYGHDAGDRVLVELAQRVQAMLRGPDLLARWGGEEFVVILPETGVDEAQKVAERLRAHIATTPFPEVGTQSISLGVTEFRADDTSDTLRKRADQALYKAKHQGRNQVVAN